MSKRHQSHRRKSYGRRQHELAERQTRHEPPSRLEHVADELGYAAFADPLALVGPRAPRVRYLLGD